MNNNYDASSRSFYGKISSKWGYEYFEEYTEGGFYISKMGLKPESLQIIKNLVPFTRITFTYEWGILDDTITRIGDQDMKYYT